MADSNPAELERELADDLATLGERFLDHEFCAELYRALASRTWRKDGGPDGHLALSWSRAEAVVNGLRAIHDREPLELAQTGGEGEVSRLVGDELARLGWSSQELNTSRHDPRHTDQPESPPPAKQGDGSVA